MRTILRALALVVVAAGPLAAQPLDPAAREALATTLRMLRDPAQRAPVIAGDPHAAALDRQVQALAGSPELTQEFYDLAAMVFEELARSAGGDPNRMRETLENAARDPAAFAALLSPATLERLRALAVRMSDRTR